MNYRFHKGIKISEIGIGSYSLSGVYGIKNREEFRRMVRRAVELGVNYFDTAPSYGEDAEELLGEALEPFSQEILLSTKVGVIEGAKFDLSSGSIRLSCERSLKRLKREKIDFLQVHFDDPKTPVQDTIETLELLKREGKILHYGIGHLPLKRLNEYMEMGSPFMLMMELSPVSRSARLRFFPLLGKHEVKGVAFSVTGRGMLASREIPESFPPGDLRNFDPLFHEDLRTSGLRIREKLSKLAQKYEKTLAQVAIAWVLSHPQIICALCGPSTIPHLEEDTKASGWQIPPDDLQKLESFLRSEDDRLAQERLETTARILAAPPSKEADTPSLIYALDTLIESGFIEEKDGLPLFLKIMRLEKLPAKDKIEAIKNIKGELSKYLSA